LTEAGKFTDYFVGNDKLFLLQMNFYEKFKQLSASLECCAFMRNGLLLAVYFKFQKQRQRRETFPCLTSSFFISSATRKEHENSTS